MKPSTLIQSAQASLAKTPGVVVVVVLTSLFLLPFVNKPFHIDDPAFLAAAHHIQQESYHLYNFDYKWSEVRQSMWSVMRHPPLNSYLLFLVFEFLGDEEFLAHLVYASIAVGCAALQYLLAKDLCKHPVLATLLSVVAPAFLVSATNVMADIPMLCFWLLAVYATWIAVKTDRHWYLWLAGIAATAAAMTKYFGIAVVPLLLVYWLLATRRWTTHLLALALPVLAVLGWGLYAFSQCGYFHPLDAARSSTQHKSLMVLVEHSAHTLCYIGGGMLWSLFWLPACFRLPRLMRAGVCASFLIICLITWWLQIELVVAVPYVLMGTAGGLVLIVSLASWRATPDAGTTLLALWAAGTIVFAGLLNWTVNARIILPAIFPLTVLIVRFIEALPRDGKRMNRWLRSCTYPTLAVSVLVAMADYEFALSSKTFAEETIRQLVRQGRTVHIIGSWGFLYYMQREGALPLPLGGHVKENDLIVVPDATTHVWIPRSLPTRPTLLREFPSHIPLRTNRDRESESTGGGFYASHVPLPFGWSSDSIVQKFFIFEVMSEGVAHVQSAQVNVDWGVRFFETDKLDFAIFRFETALEIDPDNVAAHAGLAKALDKSDRIEDARRHHRMATILSPDDPELHNEFGKFLLNRVKNRKAAINQFQDTLRLDPQHKDAKLNLKRALEN